MDPFFRGQKETPVTQNVRNQNGGCRPPSSAASRMLRRSAHLGSEVCLWTIKGTVFLDFPVPQKGSLTAKSE